MVSANRSRGLPGFERHVIEMCEVGERASVAGGVPLESSTSRLTFIVGTSAI